MGCVWVYVEKVELRYWLEHSREFYVQFCVNVCMNAEMDIFSAYTVQFVMLYKRQNNSFFYFQSTFYSEILQ